MILLFEKTEYQFTSQGLGVLSDAISCTVHEAINGEFELEMTYPTNGIHYNDLVCYRFIGIKLPYLTNIQPFRIYKIGQTLCGLTTFYARHRHYDLGSLCKLKPSYVSYSTASAAINYLNSEYVYPRHHYFHCSHIASGTWSVAKLESFMSLMASVVTEFGGEWEYDKNDYTLKTRRGADNGYTIEYGKNLLDLKKSIDNESDVTSVTVIWYGKVTDQSYPYGDRRFVSVSTGRSLPIDRDYIIDVSNDYKSDPGDSVLGDVADAFIALHGLDAEPDPSIELDFLALETVGTNIALGDTVKVKLTDATVSLRAVEITWDCLTERYTNIKLGSVEDTLSDTIVNIAVDAENNKNREKVYQLYGQRSITISTASSGVKVITSAEINLLLGVNDSSPSNTFVMFCNPNGSDMSAHVDGATYLPSTDAWYATLDSNVSGTKTFNYMILYRRKQDV